MDILLSPETKQAVNNFVKKPVHALLIIGAAGSGKAYLAKHIAERLLETNRLDIYPYFRHLKPVKGTISIETVREIQEFVRLKTIGDKSVRRLLIIEQADAMTTEAQNALLKILEEPPEDTVIILTSPPEGRLLPTIKSRTLRLMLGLPEKMAAIDHFQSNGGHKSVDLERAYSLSGGQIGLMTALLDPETEHPLNAAIEQAKQIIAADSFSRLAMVDKLSKQKEELPNLIIALSRIYRAVLGQAIKANKVQQIQKSHAALENLLQAENSLKHNPNAKLLLTDLFLHI